MSRHDEDLILPDAPSPQAPLLNGSLPGWIKAAATLGVPSVIALVLVWFMAARLDSRVDTIAETLNSHVGSMQSVQLAEDAREQRLLRVIRQVCFNTAQTEAQRAACQTP